MDLYFPNYCIKCGKNLNKDKRSTCSGDNMVMAPIYTLCKKCKELADEQKTTEDQ